MARKRLTIVLSVVAIWAFTYAEAASHHSAPAPGVDCSSLVLNMADCLSFVTQGSTVTKPEGSCCSGLKTVLKTDAECLCEGFKNSAQMGVTLNVSKALTLPSACHVSAPSVSNCGLDADAGPAPALPPMALSPTSTAAAPTTVAGATALPPAGAPGSTGSSSALAVPALTLVLGAVAASRSIF